MHRAPPQRRSRPGCPAGFLIAAAVLVLVTAALVAAAFLIYRR